MIAILLLSALQSAAPGSRVVRAAGPSEMAQVYDVRDLLDALPPSFELAPPGSVQFLGARASQVAPGEYKARTRVDEQSVSGVGGLAALGYVGTSSPDDAREQRRAKCQALTRLVRGFIAPPLVEGRDEITGYAEPGILLLKSPPEGHAWMQQFLALQSRPLRQLEVKLWALEAPTGALGELGLGGDGRTTLQAGAASAFLERAGKSGANLLTAPTMLLYERSIGSLTALDAFTYVKEFRFVTVQPGNETIADPVIETLPEGWSMEVLGAEVGAGEFGVELFARQQVVQRPVPTQQISIGRSDTATVSTPVGLTHELKTRFALPLSVLPYTGEAWQESQAPAQVFRLTTSVPNRELAVLIQVRVRECKPVEPRPDTK